LLSVPFLFVRSKLEGNVLVDGFGLIFSLSILILSVFYYTSYRSVNQSFDLFQFIKRFMIFLLMSMGMSLHNSIAVLEGYFGVKSPFVRTPKFNLQSDKKAWRANVYVRNTSIMLMVVESAFSFLFAIAILIGVYLKDYALIPFHLLLSVGFGLVVFYSAKHTVE